MTQLQIGAAWFIFWGSIAWSMLAWLNQQHLKGEVRHWRTQYYRVLAQNDQLYAQLLEREARP